MPAQETAAEGSWVKSRTTVLAAAWASRSQSTWDAHVVSLITDAVTHGAGVSGPSMFQRGNRGSEMKDASELEERGPALEPALLKTAV